MGIKMAMPNPWRIHGTNGIFTDMNVINSYKFMVTVPYIWLIFMVNDGMIFMANLW